MILKNYTSVPITKERLSPMSEAWCEASGNMFLEKSGVPDKVESLEKSIVVRIILEPGLGLLDPSKID